MKQALCVTTSFVTHCFVFLRNNFVTHPHICYKGVLPYLCFVVVGWWRPRRRRPPPAGRAPPPRSPRIAPLQPRRHTSRHLAGTYVPALTCRQQY